MRTPNTSVLKRVSRTLAVFMVALCVRIAFHAVFASPQGNLNDYELPARRVAAGDSLYIKSAGYLGLPYYHPAANPPTR